jgi:hypothetical protein
LRRASPGFVERVKSRHYEPIATDFANQDCLQEEKRKMANKMNYFMEKVKQLRRQLCLAEEQFFHQQDANFPYVSRLPKDADPILEHREKTSQLQTIQRANRQTDDKQNRIQRLFSPSPQGHLHCICPKLR